MSISETQTQDCTVPEDVDQQDLVDAVLQLTEQNRQLREDNDELREEVDDLREEVDDLREEVDDLQEHTAKERAEDRQRLTDAEDRLDDLEERLTSGKTMGSDREEQAPEASTTPQTPLERTTAMPQEMIEAETANVRRAVFVAEDLEDYTTKVPAGRAIRSSELRRVLKAGTDSRGHSQTVDRVIQVLDDLGGDDVQVVDRRGERRVVFTEAIVERLEELTAEQEASHGVVTEQTV